MGNSESLEDRILKTPHNKSEYVSIKIYSYQCIRFVMTQNNLGNTKARFGTRKVLGKGKKKLRKIIFPCLVYHEKYKRKANIIKIPQNFTYFQISYSLYKKEKQIKRI